MNTALRLLLVDDHIGLRTMMGKLLGSPEIEIVGEAGDGSVAVEAARRLAPDIVLMDYHMPVMDGLTAARLILAGADPPIIMLLSGDVDDSLRAVAQRIGIRAVFQKGAPAHAIRAELLAAYERLHAPLGHAA